MDILARRVDLPSAKALGNGLTRRWSAWHAASMLASLALAFAALAPAPPLVSGPLDTDEAVVAAIAAHYTKHEALVPMRDGVRLHTTIYVPKPTLSAQTWPILMTRTPYGVSPYGVDNLPDASNHRRLTRFAPSPTLIKSCYIFERSACIGFLIE